MPRFTLSPSSSAKKSSSNSSTPPPSSGDGGHKPVVAHMSSASVVVGAGETREDSEASAPSSMLSNVELDEQYGALSSVCAEFCAGYLLTRIDPNDKVVTAAGLVTHTDAYKPVLMSQLTLALANDLVLDVSLASFLKSNPAGALSSSELFQVTEAINAKALDTTKKQMVKLLVAVLGCRLAAADENMALYCSAVALVVKTFSADYDVMRLCLGALYRLTSLSAKVVGEECLSAMVLLGKAFSTGDMKTFIMVNLVLVDLAPMCGRGLVVGTGLVASLVHGLEHHSRGGFPMRLSLQVQSAVLEFFAMAARIEDPGCVIIREMSKEGAPQYATRLFKNLQGKHPALEKFILNLLIAMSQDESTTSAFLDLGVVKMCADCLERQPQRSLRLLALMSMSKEGSLAIMGIDHISDKLTKFLNMHSGLESSCVVVAKYLMLFNPDFVRELQDRDWFPRIVELFAQSSMSATSATMDHGILLDLAAFMIICTSVNHASCGWLVDLKVVPICLKLILMPNQLLGTVVKLFSLLDHLVFFAKGAASVVEYKGVAVAISMLCNFPEERELVMCCLLMLDHCAAAGAEFAKAVITENGKDAIEAIAEAYAADEALTKVCVEALHLLSLSDFEGGHRRVFAATSVASSSSQQALLVDSSTDPLLEFRYMLTSGSILVEWNPLSKHANTGVKKHIVATPTFSALVVKDVSGGTGLRGAMTIFFRDLRSVYSGVEQHPHYHLIHSRPVFTLISRGVTTVFECPSQDECASWVHALQIVLHLARHHDTKWLNLNDA